MHFQRQAFTYFKAKLFDQLSQFCLPPFFYQLAGGWHVQTFHQIIQKLTRNRTAPLPMQFKDPEDLQDLTVKKHLQQMILRHFDAQSVGRIDSSELFAMLILLVKGTFQSKLGLIIQIYGFQNKGQILPAEFGFFLDALFRALAKSLLKSKKNALNPRLRLAQDDIKRITREIFANERHLNRQSLFNSFNKHQVNQLIKYVQGLMQKQSQRRRSEALQQIKTVTVIKKIVQHLVSQVETNILGKKNNDIIRNSS